jgi:hypothetical protein
MNPAVLAALIQTGGSLIGKMGQGEQDQQSMLQSLLGNRQPLQNSGIQTPQMQPLLGRMQ